MEKKTQEYLKLLLIPRIGNARFARIISQIETDVNDIFKIDKQDLRKILGISDKEAFEIINSKNIANERFVKELEQIEKHQVTVIRIDEQEYPKQLRNLFAPPPLLFIKGKILDQDMMSIAIVGTRYPSTYGANIAYDLAQDLADRKITVISGLARGIDAYAHKGALKRGGRTIAVCGTGLATTYPVENIKLREEIEETGAVISEFPMTTNPDKHNFPLRNRVISGLSLGTCVVEAAARSGALITARYAMEQGKEVFAVPGNITNIRAVGPHKLIQDGAKLVINVEDILEELKEPLLWKDKRVNITESSENDKSIKTIGLSEEEKKIYGMLCNEDKLHIEVVAENLGMNLSDLLGILTGLELKGMIKQLAGKFYCKAN